MIPWTKHDCFQHDMAYKVYKDIQKRRPFGKVLRDEILESSHNPKSDGYQHGIASVVYRFLVRKPRDTTHNGTGICNALLTEYDTKEPTNRKITT